MMATAKKELNGNPELGAKLANFRRKLAISIGQKKITQLIFGEMFGGYSGRAIASYELGDSEAPASLFYNIWKAGNSIDNLFSEGEIGDVGRLKAASLHEATVAVCLQDMNDQQLERITREIENANHVKNGSPEKVAPETATKRKTGNPTPRKNKKR